MSDSPFSFLFFFFPPQKTPKKTHPSFIFFSHPKTHKKNTHKKQKKTHIQTNKTQKKPIAQFQKNQKNNLEHSKKKKKKKKKSLYI
jgi:hypothetical protein